MKHAFAWLVLSAALLAPLATVRAEVRVEQARPSEWRLRVHETAAGPWTPVVRAGDATLNAEGDARGDGLPGWASVRDGVVTAWSTPAGGGQLRVALAQSGRWVAESVAPGITATTQAPFVTPFDETSAWVIAAVADDAAPSRVHVGLASLEGALSIDMVGAHDGRLIGLASTDASLHLLVEDNLDGALTIITWRPPVPPIDIPRSTTLALGVMADLVRLPGTGQDVVYVSSERTSLQAPPPGRGLGTVRPRSAKTATLAQVPSGHALIVTWWSGPRTLSFVELTPAGPALPVERRSAHHGPERPPHLIQEAIRAVRERRR